MRRYLSVKEKQKDAFSINYRNYILMQANVRDIHVLYLYLNDELDATVYLSGNQACA